MAGIWNTFLIKLDKFISLIVGETNNPEISGGLAGIFLTPDFNDEQSGVLSIHMFVMSSWSSQNSGPSIAFSVCWRSLCVDVLCVLTFSLCWRSLCVDVLSVLTFSLLTFSVCWRSVCWRSLCVDVLCVLTFSVCWRSLCVDVLSVDVLCGLTFSVCWRSLCVLTFSVCWRSVVRV